MAWRANGLVNLQLRRGCNNGTTDDLKGIKRGKDKEGKDEEETERIKHTNKEHVVLFFSERQMKETLSRTLH